MTAPTVPPLGAARPALPGQPLDPADARAPGQAAAFALLLAAGLQPEGETQAALALPPVERAGEDKDANKDKADAAAGAAPVDPAVALALAAFQPAAGPAPAKSKAPAAAAPRPVAQVEAPPAPRLEAKRETPAAPPVPAERAEPAYSAAAAPAKAAEVLSAPDARLPGTPPAEAPAAPERAGAELALGALHRVPTPAAAPVYEIRAPLHAPAWEGDVAHGIQWMASERLQSASLQLNPPDLGPVQVVLHLSGDGGAQASVSFASPHADVRAALEASLPRLRDMLGQAGIQLGHASVGADAFPQPGGDAGGGRGAPALNPAAPAAPASAGAALARAGQGLIDTFV